MNLIINCPPSYERLVWGHNKANVEGIKKSIDLVNWEAVFDNRSVHKEVSIFNEILLNIF